MITRVGKGALARFSIIFLDFLSLHPVTTYRHVVLLLPLFGIQPISLRIFVKRRHDVSNALRGNTGSECHSIRTRLQLSNK